MCVCVYGCMKYVYIYVRLYLCICACVCAKMRMYVNTEVRIFVRMCIYEKCVCIFLCIYVSMFKPVCIM